MSYQQLLLSAREQGELRRQERGLGKRERVSRDTEEDTDLLTGKGIAKKSLIPSREKQSTESELDFMSEYFYKLQASNIDLKSQIQEALERANAEPTQKEPKLNVEKDKSSSISDTGTRLKIELEEVLGLEDFQAAAIVGNLAHETGDFKFMQELDPVVPGSRGGLGFAQWTGPRRKAFEAWSSQNNLNVNSYEANFGFMIHEIQSDPYYSKIIERLGNTKNIDEATEVFSKGYLKPGIPKMNLRKKKSRVYLGK